MGTVVEGLIRKSWPAIKPALLGALTTAATTVLDLLAADYPAYAAIFAECKAALVIVAKL